MKGWLRRHAAVLVLCGLVLALCLPALLGQLLYQGDNLRYNYPEKAYLRQRLWAGELPLWNPRLGLGSPMLSLVQPAVLYPANLLLLLPWPAGYDLFLALHLLLGALGMRRLLGRFEVADDAATVGAGLFALSGYVISMFAGSGAYLVGAAFLPWALAARGPVTLGLALGLCVLGGEPQSAWLGGGLALLFAADRRAIVRVLGGYAFALALALPVLLPALDTMRVARPEGVRVAEAGLLSLPPRRLCELFWPHPFADVRRLYDQGDGVLYEPWAQSLYMGVATPWLALAGLRRRRRELTLGGVALVALVLALGRHTPIWPAFFRIVPGARLFRYPEKYAAVLTLALCALAALGLSRLPRWRLLCGSLILVELLTADLRLVRWTPSQIYRERSPVAADLDLLEGARVHRLYRVARYGYFPGDAIDPVRMRATLLPDSGIEHGIEQLDGYAIFQTPWETALRAALAAHPVRLLEVTATRWALLGDAQLGPQLKIERRYPELGATLVRIERAAPRVYLAQEAQPAGSVEDAAAKVAAPGFVPGKSAVVEGGQPRAAQGRCDLASETAERLVLACDASAPAYAIVSDGWFPGWSARVDEKPAPLLRANAALRAVPIPAGHSSVVLEYRARGLRAGLVVAALALALAVGLVMRNSVRG